MRLRALETIVTSLLEELRTSRMVRPPQVQETDPVQTRPLSEAIERDTSLRNLGESLRSLAEELHAPRTEELAALHDITPILSTPNVAVDLRDREACADALLAMSSVYGTQEDLWRLRDYFLDMYTHGPLTTPFLTFLRGQQNVDIVVDYEHSNLVQSRPQCCDLDGWPLMKSKRGRSVRALCYRRKVYVTAKSEDCYTPDRVFTWMTIALARLCVYLVFRNEGRPYFKGDQAGGKKYRAILDEGRHLFRQLGASGCNWYLWNALDWHRSDASEIALISAVPGIMAHWGHDEGTKILLEQLPSLLNFYKEHVLNRF